MEDTKPVHTLVVDTGPLIQNVPTVSSLLASAQTLITHPAVIGEIRDAATRSRLETTLRPFLTLREPKAESVKFVQDFARRSGDLEVLSRPDILLLALTYEVECERNAGDWRLRKTPGQKGLNGKPPVKESAEGQVKEEGVEGKIEQAAQDETEDVSVVEARQGPSTESTEPNITLDVEERLKHAHITDPAQTEAAQTQEEQPETSPQTHPPSHSADKSPDATPPPEPTETDDSSDGGEWITSSNLSKHQARESNPSSTPSTSSKHTTLQSALITTDHAMQNVALLMNLNLLSPSLTRITQLRTTTQRCHACFLVIRPSDKPASSTPRQFCPRCGLPSLTKVTCSTSARDGTFQVYLKKNMQWNNRGSRFSIPKPTPGATSDRFKQGGGKGGWGNELVLAEDQKEYVQAVKEGERARRKEKNLMDEDFWPGILGGKESGGVRAGGRIKIGGGKDVNSKRRR